MHRLTLLCLLIPLAGCIETTIDRPPETAAAVAAAAEARRVAERNRVRARVHADEGYRQMNEDRDDAALNHFFKALELDPENDRALAGVKLVHDRVSGEPLGVRYERMIKLYAQDARAQIDSYLTQAAEQLARSRFRVAREKVAAAGLVLDARKTVFGGPEQRILRNSIDRADAAIVRAESNDNARIRRIREQAIEDLRMQQIGRYGHAWTTYEN
jgi:hypothetical protein